jgi:hypothetical protein
LSAQRLLDRPHITSFGSNGDIIDEDGQDGNQFAVNNLDP